MKIPIEEVEYVARLARLSLSEEEKELFTDQLNSILEYMEKLNAVDTSEVEPTFHVVTHQNRMREDKVKESLSAETSLQNAPDDAEGYFRVPRII
jgi:aspartyl-tRNA(Asn)/glutamyl-tRNA(Gln) amidotransferase subunit C